MTKIFILGITGYIGGTAAAVLIPKHQDYEITALVRNEDQEKQVKDAFPNVTTVHGDLDSLDIIKKISAESDIVFHCANSDHLESVQAILDGLGSQSKKTFYIHTTGVFHFFNQDTGLDEPTERVWSDVGDLEDIRNLPVAQPHGPIDKLVLSRGGYDNVNIAMLDPPAVYGKGLGPGKTRGTLLPILVKGSLLNKKALKLGEGKVSWSGAHVELLGEVVTWLVEEAANGGGKAEWNEKGWYFVENDTYNWADISKSLAKIGEAIGYFKTADVDSLSLEELEKVFEGDWVANLLAFTLGAGVRIRSDRLKELGWDFESNPKPSSVATLEQLIRDEAKELNIDLSG